MSFARTLSKAYLVILSLFMVYLSYRWIIDIDAHLAMLGITVEGVHGINTLKSIMGSGLLMFAILPALYLWQGTRWFAPLFLFMSVLLVVRVFSLTVDGFHLKMAIYALLEALVLVALYVTEKTAIKAK